MFDTVLVANRGEIAVRVIRTLRVLGVRAVAVYSDADAGAPHVALADAAVRLGPAPAVDSYLHGERILEAAASTGAQAIHPGYGFLSERAAFARACAAAGIVFVGPPPEAIEAMGDKIDAKRLAESAGVPVVPGVHEPGLDDAALIGGADRVGFPLMVKAAAGGGGKGMRVVTDPGGLPDALAAARREAQAAFGDDALLLERLIEVPRHVEIQVLADAHGRCIALGERECSLQRRHQKVIEEAPSPALDTTTRERMAGAAVALGRAVGYVGAGTVEFIVPSADPADFAFLEMNTRLQVEHPVTEAVYGVDLVEQQLRVAAGERLALDARALHPQGHAIEARVYAEDPGRGFLPTGGRIHALTTPAARAGVRLDFGVAAGETVGTHYDPMLGKVVAHAPDRPEALRRLDAALADLHLLGITTNVGFLRHLLADPDVRAGRVDTGLIARLLAGGAVSAARSVVPDEVLVLVPLLDLAAAEPPAGVPVDPFDVPGGWRVGEPAWAEWHLTAVEVGGLGEVSGETHTVRVTGTARNALVRLDDGDPRPATLTLAGDGDADLHLAGSTAHWHTVREGERIWFGREGRIWQVQRLPRLASSRAAAQGLASGPLRAPLPGTVTVVAVAEGDAVIAGQMLVVVEAMKMEHPVTAPVDGVVAKVVVRAGQQVTIDAELVLIEPAVAAEPAS
ncbi:MAG: ATP-grasp domain-containing protein [Nitriliruptorales bacterium]|nr:ATP-grasp domain-containing protein [Nitriliruptorales bacterium]